MTDLVLYNWPLSSLASSGALTLGCPLTRPRRMTANDVCGDCAGPKDLTQWANKTEELLANLTASHRRVYVNLMSTLHLSDIARLQRSKLGCSLEHRCFVCYFTRMVYVTCAAGLSTSFCVGIS